MGFIKIGDSMPIGGMMEPKNGDGQAVCPSCQAPLVTVAFDEEGTAKLICQCDSPELISESN